MAGAMEGSRVEIILATLRTTASKEDIKVLRLQHPTSQAVLHKPPTLHHTAALPLSKATITAQLLTAALLLNRATITALLQISNTAKTPLMELLPPKDMDKTHPMAPHHTRMLTEGDTHPKISNTHLLKANTILHLQANTPSKEEIYPNHNTAISRECTMQSILVVSMAIARLVDSRATIHHLSKVMVVVQDIRS